MSDALVTGIGGVFFRAKDPAALQAWYKKHLDVGGPPHGLWFPGAGPSVFAPFKADTDYFGRADQQWMINLRVSDLDALMKKLSDAGITVETRPDEWDVEGVGRFARVHDPEGNPIELWEPDPNAQP
ncbi:MAG: VOC family protein [Pseudomonadota bacterium]